MTESNDRILSQLTRRHRQIAWLLANGHSTNAEIAQVMGLKKGTVHSAMTRIFDATGMSTRVEVALYVARNKELEEILRRSFDVSVKINRKTRGL